MLQIEILPTSPTETNEFEKAEWSAVDEEHWGREIEWKLVDYRFKALLDGKIAGIIFGKFEAGTTYVDNIITGKEFRGREVGTKLMEFIENWTLEQGGHKVWLVTHKKWRANSLYLKLGYQVTATLKKHFLTEDFLLYEKFLTE